MKSTAHASGGRSAILLLAFLVSPCPARAQTADRPIRLGAVVATVASAEFDSTEPGIGVQVAWLPISLVGAEVEVVIHPADLGPDPAFSSGRVETLFGVSIGPRLDRW